MSSQHAGVGHRREGAHRVGRREFLRLTGAGAASVGLFGLGGCLGGDDAPTGAKVSGDVEAELKIALFGTRTDAERRAALVPPFNRKFPNVKVSYTPIQGKDWEEFFSKVLTQVAAGKPPDIVFVATEGTQLFAGEGLAIPLDDYVKRDRAELVEYFADVHPALVEAMMHDGHLYELPIDFNAANMYLNMKAVRAAGIDYPAADWTVEDFTSMARKAAATGGNAGYGWVNRLWGGWMPWIFANDSNLLEESRAAGGEWLWDTFYKGDPAAEGRGGGWRWDAPKANDPANVEMLQFMLDLQEQGVSPKADLGGGETIQGFFTTGRIAMTPAGGFWAGGLHDAGLKPTDFDVQLWPRVKTQRHQFGTAGYVITERSENKDIAWEYIKYLASREAMTIEFKGNYSTPTRKSMMTAERYEETGPRHWQVFYDTLTKHPDTAPIPAPPESNTMTTIFTKYTGEAVAGQKSAQQALDAMQKDLEALWAKRS